MSIPLSLDPVRRIIARYPHVFAGSLIALAATMATVALWLAWAVTDAYVHLPPRDAVKSARAMPSATVLYDAFDRPAFTIYTEQRIEKPLDQISPLIVRAVLAVEDQRFFEHNGLDLRRTLAAVMVNLRAGRAAQGASTITQQLARQCFLTPAKTLHRKIQEAVLAARLESEFSKDELLALYLNKVYFGDGLYGVEAASLGYFGKHAKDVDLAEAALLAGLIKAPSRYAPTMVLERAVARRAVVLGRMRDEGMIDKDAYERAKAARVTLRNGLEREEAFGLYYKEEVRRRLVEMFGSSRVLDGGLRVFTALDPAMQQAAEIAVEENAKAIESRKGFKHPRRPTDLVAATAGAPDYLQSALVAIDPRSGEVRALVGGRSFADSPFNRAMQAKRQPGSAFKPFVYAAALESGFTPASLVKDLDTPVETLEGAWLPDDDHSDGEEMTFREALRGSSNRAAVRVLETVGIDRVVQAANRFHIGNLPSVPSLALGSGETTLASLTAAYGAFANGGLSRAPVLIRRVEDSDGVPLFIAEDAPSRAISEPTAFLVASMLADVVNAGTGSGVRRVGFTLPAGGKTGTTNDYQDVWFVGFTPSLVAGVWLGFDQPQPIAVRGYAADLAAPMWGKFMKAATMGAAATWLKTPAGVRAVQICRLSGQLPTDVCRREEIETTNGRVKPAVYTDYFRSGTEPKSLCTLHEDHNVFERIADLFQGGHDPAPTARVATPEFIPAPERHGPSVEPAAVTVQEDGPQMTESKKKRGFWSRVFGRGRDNERRPNPEPPRRREP